MIIFPAIDLKNGQCVRLFQGDYAQMTIYDSNPVNVAHRWQEAGAEWLHLVDLDGAASGEPINLDVIAAICQETSLRVELGGGIRSLERLEQIFSLGVERAILGTVAITNPQLVHQAVKRWGDKIAVGLDARDGFVAISGWQERSQVRATTLAKELSDAGVSRFIYTDIARDGAMQGPNLTALREMIDATPNKLIASGGVSSHEDLRVLHKLPIEGVIIGKALYTGDIDLAQAFQELERTV